MSVLSVAKHGEKVKKHSCRKNWIKSSKAMEPEVAVECLRAFIGVETAALTFRTKQYSTSYSSHIYYGKRFCNDFFSNHNTIALVRNCLKLLSCVVIETALDRMKKNQLSEHSPFN